MSFAKEAWPFVLPFLLLGAILALTGRRGPAIAVLVAGFLVLLFFRDPARRFDGGDGIVLAPADGLVTAVEEVVDESIGPGPYLRVVTFLSVFDVHVQRCPVSGKVVHSELTRGLKLAAFRDDIADKNERHSNVIVRPNGDRIGVRQLAGLLARRVVSYIGSGDDVQRGQLLGVIKFGSRVDLYVPASYRVLVKKGDRVKNGATPMAEAPAADPGTGG
ncbi:MAG: phosphatidylserine decarboxylase [Thermoanaerobaculia bacterium]